MLVPLFLFLFLLCSLPLVCVYVMHVMYLARYVVSKFQSRAPVRSYCEKQPRNRGKMIEP